MSFYPKLTFAWRGILNPLSTNAEKEVYKNLGFDQSHTLDKWVDYDKHTCRRDGSCPQTVRSTEDSHMLFIGFPFDPEYCDDEGPETQAIRHPYCISNTWSLAAGNFCKDQRPYIAYLRSSSLTFPFSDEIWSSSVAHYVISYCLTQWI